MHSSLVQRFFTTIALLALVALLAFGGGVRYFCYCEGSPVLTLHEHCHGDHGEKGPVHHAPAGHHHHDDHDTDGDGGHDDHHHELVQTSTDLRLPDAVTLPEGKLIVLLWTALSEGDAMAAEIPLAARFRPPIGGDPPPLAQVVAKQTVRLI